MSGKPWKSEPRGSQLEAFVGAFGIHTSQFSTTGELIWFACKLFDLDPVGVETAEQAASMIEGIGKKERSRRARANQGHLFPNEDFAKPAASQVAKQGATEVAPITADGLQRMMDASKPELIDGDDFDVVGDLDIDPAQLLRKVVSAVISADRADILWEFPDVLAFFGSRIPQREEVAHLHNVDQRMFEAADKWPNRKPAG